MASGDAAEDDDSVEGGLLAWAALGDGGGPGAGTSSPDRPARRGRPVGSLGASSGAGPGRQALVTSLARANGGGQH